MKKFLKSLKKTVICLIVLSTFFNAQNSYSAVTYYEAPKRQNITKSLFYETNRMVTDAGFLDVYVMKVPLDDPYIYVSPVRPVTEYGLKETTTRILEDNGAIGGINGDFFGVAGDYSVPLGIEITSGVLTSAGTYSNANSNESAGLFITENGNPFIEYLKLEIQFFNDEIQNIEIAAINKTVEAAYPTVFTRDIMETTKDLDSRLNGLVKITVENDYITAISKKGEIVSLPEDGYIIVINSETADRYISKFAVGQTASLIVTPSFDLSGVQAAIGGAGKLLKDGAIANDTGFVTSGRHPRTALGYTKDKKTLILMVVDGRNNSIGATHAEMASLMLKYGAYDAMHLDGGGSSTMAVRPAQGSEMAVLNNPSDGGSQRKVINALGVFMNAPVGALESLIVKPSQINAIKGHSIPVEVYGTDGYNNRIALDPSKIAMYVTDGSGVFFDGEFYPNRTGAITLYATYDETFIGFSEISVNRLSQIKPSVTKITTSQFGVTPISFTGVDSEGNTIRLDEKAINYEVFPKELGTMKNGVFTAQSIGKGWIRCFTGAGLELVEAYINISATLIPSHVDPLDGEYPVKYGSYPESVSGVAEYIVYGSSPDSKGIRLQYSFERSESTQAAYVIFENPIVLPENTRGLRIAVHGSSSLDWIRGRVIDADGIGYNIDFTRFLDFSGWRDLDAIIPENIKQPIRLERLYAVSLSQTEKTSSTMYFDALRVLTENSSGMPDIKLPSSTEYKDTLNVEFYGAPAGNAYDITMMGILGGTSSEDHLYNRQLAIKSFTENSSGGLYFGASNVGTGTQIPIFSNPYSYRAVVSGGFYALQLHTVSGGMFSTQKSQWAQIKNGINANPHPFLIIQTDVSPLRFDNKNEFELLHDLLVEYSKKGVKVFVVSSDNGTQNTVTVKDGIRYINLGKLYVNDELNKDFSILRFRVDGDNIKYSLEKLYK